MRTLAFLLAASLTLLAVHADERPGYRSCPGGYQHGEQFETGRYWYECQDGQRVPKGCLSDNGGRVEVQGTFDKEGSRMQCVLGADGYLTILYKSCVYNGREYDVNERWDDGQKWYTCKKESNAVQPSEIGCVYENQPLAFDDRVAKGDKVYSCKRVGSGRVEMGITGCAMGSSKYNIGETATSTKLWYTCTDNGWKVIGCFHNGAKLRDGDTYKEDDIGWKCVVNDDKTGPVPYACITHANGVEEAKNFECFWTEGTAPYQYEYNCKYDEVRNIAVRVPIKCKYHAAEGSFVVDPGCYYRGNGLAVGCIRDSSTGNLQTKTFPEDQIDTSLSQC